MLMVKPSRFRASMRYTTISHIAHISKLIERISCILLSKHGNLQSDYQLRLVIPVHFALFSLFEDQPQPPADPTHSSSAMHLLLTQDIPMTEGDIQPHQSPPANKFMHVAECLDNRPSKDMLASSMVEDFAMQMEAQSLPAPASLQFIVESSGML
jgi:hypothetical protein